jgi:iron complex transport system permease protein
LTAIVTAYCGPIAFLGLAIPHLTRFIFKTSDHRILVPAVMLIGMIVSLLCNLVARMPGFEGNLPINAVTAFIGAPIVIWVILRRR